MVARVVIVVSGWQVAKGAAWQRAGQHHWRKIVYGSLVLRFVVPALGVLLAVGALVWAGRAAWSAGVPSVSWPGLHLSWPGWVGWWLLAPAVLVAGGVVVARSWRLRYRLGSLLRLR